MNADGRRWQRAGGDSARERAINGNTVVCVLVESLEAWTMSRRSAALEGIDMIGYGYSDLSWGCGG